MRHKSNLMVEIPAVILAGGHGTRLMPSTLAIPKSIFPIPIDGELKPIIQKVFESFFEYGIRNFYICSDNKSPIKKHFTCDNNIINKLKNDGKRNQAAAVERFYNIVMQSRINCLETKPTGTGKPLLELESILGDNFFVSAADVIVYTIPFMPNNSLLAMDYKRDKNYNYISIKEGKIVDFCSYNASGLKYRFLPYMHLDKDIFRALKDLEKEKQKVDLKDGLRKLIKEGKRYNYALVDTALDFGNYKSYLESIKILLDQ